MRSRREESDVVCDIENHSLPCGYKEVVVVALNPYAPLHGYRIHEGEHTKESTRRIDRERRGVGGVGAPYLHILCHTIRTLLLDGF